ncbi:magnesium-translocating P-type ATPase [Fimbriimonas ginsengisoli]|uniref:Magnesium-transporting ATPase, P-type 1 n=1 Tax=Fimbriimonas ginsengisoli Gsoil 348 TaxID=661478 RepID=A0A068NTE5_FIMGI|nr:magnesium-translocating P-type ATPase [Fimbriimonas ginsengisoli]AIE86597.1 magnesium-transporting ATPase, P-type [Fimbriimonas ginsengisoli Gsoil 348]
MPGTQTPSAGLTSGEARLRLETDGPNEVTRPRAHGILRFLAPLLANPLVVILLGAAAVSASLGDRVNAAIIVAMIALSFGLDWVQTRRSHQAAEKLKNSISPTAAVLRDGKWQTIARREVVVGDVVRLSAGTLIPADGRLLTEKDLHVNEAALTGESVPAEKEVGTGDDQEKLFLGTSVVSGTATMTVEKTGAQTVFGGIALRLSERPPETEFERGLRRFGGLIMRIVLLLTGFVIVSMIALHRPPLQSFMFAVALAVGLTPEFLPMITTLTLSRGALRMARHKVIVKNLASIQNFGSMDVLCSDKTGTLTSGEMRLDQTVGLDGQPSEVPLRWAALNAAFESGIANSLDSAILAKSPPEPGWRKIDEIPFDFNRRRLSVVLERDGRRVLVSKGSPEGVWNQCDAPEALLAEQTKLANSLGEQGFRVLAVAIADVPVQDSYGIEDENSLTLIGYLAFADPPLEDALATVHRLQTAGIDLKIITGDSDAVAGHVCRQIGLDPGRILLGSEIEAMADDALQAAAERTLVFARTSPAQKNRIILALKARGHVVGYMGDGINDAPSLHAADVGISFGDATDVAKDAAQIILVERHLSRLLGGVFEGRMAFGNVMKYLLMGTSSSFGNMLSMAGAALFLPFLPMLPSQILLNNLLYDLAQIPIPTDWVDESYIRKPKRWDMSQISSFMIFAGPISSLYDALTFVVLLRLFRADEAHFHTGWFIESLFTQTLVIFVIRTRFRPWRSRPSRALVATTILVLIVAAWLPFSPFASLLGFVPMPPAFFLFVLFASLTYLALVELAKGFLFRWGPAPPSSRPA